MSVIVTGAAQGIGAFYAKAIAAEGGKVSVSDVLAPDATVAAIKAAGGEAIGMVCDITDAAAVARMVDATKEAFGGVQGLVNNAALFATLAKKPFEEISSAEFDKVMAVNVRGSFECIKAVMPAMKAQGYGKIVNIASGTVFKGAPQMLAYVTSKGAIVAMTRSVAREVGGSGIRINCLAPGLTMSEGIANNEDYVKRGNSTVASRCLQREQLPEDLTGSVVYLLSRDSDFMTGQTIVVDGGAVTH
ncbi:MAG TPA: SDR family oxidoreductase [Stellaceae bacterium]|jgi:NAD(P)-dependent dehydrogenase (short-subunit alcohol dehydrogenase family)|nr:SDR family oxidoreductase [Stellaceae bacterium]